MCKSPRSPNSCKNQEVLTVLKVQEVLTVLKVQEVLTVVKVQEVLTDAKVQEALTVVKVQEVVTDEKPRSPSRRQVKEVTNLPFRSLAGIIFFSMLLGFVLNYGFLQGNSLHPTR